MNCSEYIYKHIKPYIRKYLDIYLNCDVCDEMKVKNKRRCKHGTLYCEDHHTKTFIAKYTKKYDENHQEIRIKYGRSNTCKLCKNTDDNVCYFMTFTTSYRKSYDMKNETYMLRTCCNEKYKNIIKKYSNYDNNFKYMYLKSVRRFIYKGFITRCELCNSLDISLLPDFAYRYKNNVKFIDYYILLGCSLTSIKVCKKCNEKIFKIKIKDEVYTKLSISVILESTKQLCNRYRKSDILYDKKIQKKYRKLLNLYIYYFRFKYPLPTNCSYMFGNSAMDKFDRVGMHYSCGNYRFFKKLIFKKL